MSKITAEHLKRQAVVYVRQSTLDQVQHNLRLHLLMKNRFSTIERR
jgi:hypothetical protein